MNQAQKRILLMFPITLGINLIVFWLFAEDKSCVIDFGSRCSNKYLLQCLVQSVFLTVLFYFSVKQKESEKQ